MVFYQYLNFDGLRKKSDLDGFVKSSNSRRANFVSSAIRRSLRERTFRTLNDYEMQHNVEVGLFTRPSILQLVLDLIYNLEFVVWNLFDI
jgi:hypothetical protein